MTVIEAGFKRGRVMWRKRDHPAAPSIAAASRMSSVIVCKPASNVTALNPALDHTIMVNVAGIAVSAWPNQLIGFWISSKESRALLMMPKSVLNRYTKTRPAADTGVTTGRKKTVRNTARALIFIFMNSAMGKANIYGTTTSPKAYTRVTRREFQNRHSCVMRM